MVRSTGVVTRKGQITIPAEMREALNLEVGDRVSFDLVDEEIHVRRIGSLVAQTAGILRGNEEPVSAERLRELAEDAIAEEAAERTDSA